MGYSFRVRASHSEALGVRNMCQVKILFGFEDVHVEVELAILDRKLLKGLRKEWSSN